MCPYIYISLSVCILLGGSKVKVWLTFEPRPTQATSKTSKIFLARPLPGRCLLTGPFLYVDWLAESAVLSFGSDVSGDLGVIAGLLLLLILRQRISLNCCELWDVGTPGIG